MEIRSCFLNNPEQGTVQTDRDRELFDWDYPDRRIGGPNKTQAHRCVPGTRMPSAICYLPFAICHPPFAIRHPPSAIRHPPSAIRHPPSAICHLPFVIWHAPHKFWQGLRTLPPGSWRGLAAVFRTLRIPLVSLLSHWHRRRVVAGLERLRRQPDAKEAALAEMALDFERAAVIADDAVADREAQACPFADRLGREEGLEDVRQVLGTDPAAVVFDLDQDSVSPSGRVRTSITPSRRTPGWH